MNYRVVKKSVVFYGKVMTLAFGIMGMVSLNAFAQESNAYSFIGTNEDGIKSAGEFAVFANDFYLCGDMEGNVAVKNLHHNGARIGLSSSVKGSKNSYVEKFITSNQGCNEILRESGCTNLLIIGDRYSVKKGNEWTISENDQVIYKSPISNVSDIVNAKNAYTIDFEKEFQGLSSYAISLFQDKDQGISVNDKERNGKIICESENNIYNLTMDEYAKLNDFDIVLEEGSVLIINLQDYDGRNLDNKISINQKREAYGGMAGNVLWNFGDYTKTVNISETNQGCILAPKAQVKLGSSHNGNIIADSVNNSGGEVHKNDCQVVIKTDETPKTSEPESTNCSQATNKPEETTNCPQATATMNSDTKSDGKTEQTTEAPQATSSTNIQESKATEGAKVEDEEVPKADNKDGNEPNTGDKTMILVALGIMIVAGIGAAGFFIYRRRNA